MAPLIGITARTAYDEQWCPPLVGARQGYIDAVVQAGGVPVVLPPIADMRTLRGMFERIDGLLLTGGVDVAPELYGEERHPRLGAVHPERDTVEVPLARWAVAERKPVLGICRGIQLLNVALGGTLYQDLEAQRPGALDHEISSKLACWEGLDHGLTLAEDSRLAELLGAGELQVNSLHHQALKDVAPDLRVVGLAPDGVIEAVEGADGGFVLGVQCHPEQLWQASDIRWRNVFRALILAAEGRP